MTTLALLGPDGAIKPAAGHFGREDFAGGENAAVSRLQFSLEPVEDGLILTCHGTNGASAQGMRCVTWRCLRRRVLLLPMLNRAAVVQQW